MARGASRQVPAWKMAAELQSLGWTEGKNLSVEARSADAKLDRLPAFALDLASCPVNVIVAYGTEATMADKIATQRIPIIFSSAGDPLGCRTWSRAWLAPVATSLATP
jgi:ABC-type uncharacterized transport system substrate-binding protein